MRGPRRALRGVPRDRLRQPAGREPGRLRQGSARRHRRARRPGRHLVRGLSRRTRARPAGRGGDRGRGRARDPGHADDHRRVPAAPGGARPGRRSSPPSKRRRGSRERVPDRSPPRTAASTRVPTHPTRPCGRGRRAAGRPRRARAADDPDGAGGRRRRGLPGDPAPDRRDARVRASWPAATRCRSPSTRRSWASPWPCRAWSRRPSRSSGRSAGGGAASGAGSKSAFVVSLASVVVLGYFTGLEAFVIRAWCTWCLAYAGLTLATLVLATLALRRPVLA